MHKSIKHRFYYRAAPSLKKVAYRGSRQIQREIVRSDGCRVLGVPGLQKC